jgi:regulator of replication initiation timing
MSAANGETLVIVINRLLLRLDARGVSANEIVACIKPLIAESEAKALSSLAMVTAESADRNISLRLERDQLRVDLELADVMYQRECEVEHELRTEVERLRAEVERLRAGIAACLDTNGHLADGEDCTLIGLKRCLHNPTAARESKGGAA